MTARKGADDSIRMLEELMRKPDGMTVEELSIELGIAWHRANHRMRSMLRGGFVEISGSRYRAKGVQPAVFRVGPRLRSAAMDAAVLWREELVGREIPGGVPARPRGGIGA